MGDNFPEDDGPLPPNLRFLRILVTVLTGVMILGVLTIVLLLVIRLNDTQRPILVHPEVFAIPAGVGTVGYSVINGYTVIIGDDGIIRVFASDTRDLVDEVILGD
ncbi:DUF6476 family protein [Jannaschia sp. CCS1]|uniref:DUF6476 family protein n=1 Tax=Jannaschia sp. (strain CCS1) TaxID=290400 RepID=UPI000053BCCD|nr:DUF6476 family protein [Jannaschia sp. CCS1]ABD56319.1 hypothetical protein Jann_3402 [Jannaschia sp. CCS1]